MSPQSEASSSESCWSRGLSSWPMAEGRETLVGSLGHDCYGRMNESIPEVAVLNLIFTVCG